MRRSYDDDENLKLSIIENRKRIAKQKEKRRINALKIDKEVAEDWNIDIKKALTEGKVINE